MIEIPLLRWGQPYESLEKDSVVHFETGEELARVHRANAGIVQRDLKKASRARDALRAIPIRELLEIVGRAGEHYMKADLPLGNGVQSPADFARMQSATTGLPEHLCAANMAKNYFVLTNLERILDSLTRGLPLEILAEGRGVESRGVPVSYQALTPVLGLVLPSNSPGVHTLWLPIIPLQIGLVFKPGPQEPWTPFRMTEAFFQAGVPREAISIYPGLGDIGAAVLEGCPKSLIFGGTATVDRYKGNPAVQVHGPGFSKILLGDDVVDDWERYLDIMALSVLANSGRGCINCSGIWASRHTEEIAEALAERFVKVRPLPANDPEAQLAAFTVPGAAKAISQELDGLVGQGGATDVTARLRQASGGDADGTDRLVARERCDFLRPTVLHVPDPAAPAANAEYMFPFVSVVCCPQDRMLGAIGQTLVASAITDDPAWRRQLIDATNIDRLNIGPIPTIQLDWLQPHEGSIVDFLFRALAFQFDKDLMRV
jgi:acyl-CoA reductase-like NAD-dependent aldehyde dehydrogenase